MKNREEKIRRRDDRLLKNEKSWRRARIGAIGFVIITICTFGALKGELLREGQKEILYNLGECGFFWLLVISWLNGRLGHIDSIKLYRKVGEQTDGKETIIYSKRVKE